MPAISIRSGMLAPYSSSTRRSSSMKGQPRRWASMRPSVDLPAPRRPTSAMRRARSALPARMTCASISLASAGNSPSGSCMTRSRMASSAAVRAPDSGKSAEIGRSRACAIACRTLADGLPAPLSICARYRSEVSDACANWRRVMPRLARWRRTSSPIAARNAAAWVASLCGPGTGVSPGAVLVIGLATIIRSYAL